MQKFIKLTVFNGVENDAVLFTHKWLNSHCETVLEFTGTVKFDKYREVWAACVEKGNTYNFNIQPSHVVSMRKRVEKDFKFTLKNYLSEYCVKVRKNESEATTELWLISHRCITVNGKQYYIPKAYGHDEATNIIQTYLYDNFQI